MSSIGLRLPGKLFGYSINEVVETAQMAEDCGFDSLFVAESRSWNTFMVLSRIAAATEEVELGPGIANVYSRTPSLLAMSLGTLDEMSNGRAFLGLGTSNRASIENWHGISYDRPLRRTRETIEIVKASHRNERFTYRGEIFDVGDYRREFEPVQQAIPVYNAALGETNRALTGEFADGWIPTQLPLEKLAYYIDDVQTSAENADRDPDEITIAPFITACVSRDRALARKRASQRLALYIASLGYAEWYRSLGFESEVKAVLEAWVVDEREAYKHISDDMLDSVTISGTPEEGRELLRVYRDNGADMPVLRPPSFASRETVETTITELASY